MADIFKEFDSSSSESGDENKGRAQDEMIFESNNVISLSKYFATHVFNKIFTHLVYVEPQQDVLLEDEIKNMNEFIEKVNKFEKITNSRLIDLWQIKDSAFQPLKVSIDI